MKAVATVPSLYPVLVDLNVVPSILGLLNHDNTDISVGVVDLLQVWLNFKHDSDMYLFYKELTDVDTLTESEDGANALIEALVERQVLPNCFNWNPSTDSFLTGLFPACEQP